LVEVLGRSRYRWLGTTRDDAVGEAYDKVAKLLGLGFPGGPAIDRLAADGDATAFELPRPMLDRPGFDFSFSGLKTAVALVVASLGESVPPGRVADLAASFQAAAVDCLVVKTERALAHTGARALNLGGGVAANRALRARLTASCKARGVTLRLPSMRLCADNAAMIALVGAWQLELGVGCEPDLDAVASLEASGMVLES
jgi:N6-L-threonylcarbamoyladenine synthase